MDIKLFDGLNRLNITANQSVIMRKVSKEILDTLSTIYDISDIKEMNFHIKGVEKIESLLIRINLNFIESDDILDSVRHRLLKDRIDEYAPGLSFMSMNKTEIIPSYSHQSPKSEINFWYKFTNEEIENWNRNFIIKFEDYIFK